MLENLSDKELFDLRDDLEGSIASIALVDMYTELMERLEEVDNEITRRDEKE